MLRSTTARSSCSAPASATASPHPADRRYAYRPPMSPLPGAGGRGDRRPQLGPRPPRSTAPPATSGVLYATGTENSGVSRVRPGRPAGVRLQRVRRPHHRRVRPSRCPVGAVAARRCRSAAPARGPATADARDRRRRRAARVELPLFMMHDVERRARASGYDHGSPVSDRYRAPFPFTGTLHRVDIDADPDGKHHDPDGRRRGRAAQRRPPASSTRTRLPSSAQIKGRVQPASTTGTAGGLGRRGPWRSRRASDRAPLRAAAG